MHIFLLLFSLLGFNEASLAKEDFPLLFSGIHSSFLKKDIPKLASEEDYYLVRGSYISLPLEAIEAVNDIGDVGFTYFIVRLLNSHYYPAYKSTDLYVNLTRKINYTEAFESIFKIMIQYFILLDSLYRTADYHQRFLNLMASILWRVDYSYKTITVNFVSLQKFQISTKEIIDALRKYAYTLEDDSVSGFEKAYYSLRNLPLEYPKDNSRILPLLLSCIHYASVIFEVGYKSLAPKTADPLMLSFLLTVNTGVNRLEYLLSRCRSNEIDKESFDNFRTSSGWVAFILEKTNFENDRHQRSKVGDILGNLYGKGLWRFEIYLRLAQFKSKHKKIIY
jgi:hypothetical protein